MLLKLKTKVISEETKSKAQYGLKLHIELKWRLRPYIEMRVYTN